MLRLLIGYIFSVKLDTTTPDMCFLGARFLKEILAKGEANIFADKVLQFYSDRYNALL